MIRLQENVMVNPLKKDGFNSAQIHIWRMRVAVVWSIIIQIMVFVTYIVFVKRDVFHPFCWVTNCINTLLSPNLWLKLLILIAIIYTQGEVCKKDYVTGPVYLATRSQKMRHVFCVRNILLMLLHMAIGSMVFLIYSSIPDGAYLLSKPCEGINSESCIVENKLFFLLGGLWIGLFYFMSDYIFGSRYLFFPLIQQFKFYRVKAALKDSIKHSIKDTMMPTLLFLFIYYTYGSLIRSRVMDVFSLKMETEPIDSINGLLDINLIFSLWLMSTVFITGMQTMELLFNVYLTEHYVFPISLEMLPQGKHVRLLDALKKSDVPIIHHLAYLDLFVLSTKCRKRREQLFTLSHPGGHPHCWNGIYQECICLVKIFTNDLSEALQKEIILKTEAPKQASKVEEVTGFHFHTHNIRKLASPISVKMVGDRSMVSQSAVEIIYNNITSWLNNKLEQLNKKPYIAYVFGESPDSRINYLLCKSQPVIWAVQSLAFLCAASLTEDRYGIVQKDLPDIITTVVGLKQVLDKLFKQNLIVKKSFAKDPLDVQMKYLLRSSVKRSLYLLAVTFGPYMKDLQLPVDVEIQMNNFLAFKEV